MLFVSSYDPSSRPDKEIRNALPFSKSPNIPGGIIKHDAALTKFHHTLANLFLQLTQTNDAGVILVCLNISPLPSPASSFLALLLLG